MREIIESPQILVDTNILLRLTKLGLPFSESESVEGHSFESTLLEQYAPCITFQNLAEYWSVAGRSEDANGLAFKPEEIFQQVNRFRDAFDLLPNEPSAVDIWMKLCRKYQVSGKRAHDVRLASSALANGVVKILTLNSKDFENFEEVQVLTPDSISRQETKESGQ